MNDVFVSAMNIPFGDFGGVGKELVFLHANGYPPDCYRPLLLHLADHYHVTAMVQRPLWTGSRPEELKDWHLLTDDFLRFLDETLTASSVCVGHSMGGIALLRAALREPDRFKAIVLLDPVLFPPYMITLWNLMSALKLRQRFNPKVTRARQRRRQFDNLERLYSGYRRKSVFKYMDNEALRAYVNGISCKKDGGGFHLCYSVDWEIRIYLTAISRDMDLWRGLRKLKTPALILRGSETDTFWNVTGNLVKQVQPRIQVVTLEKATHLLPLEHPDEVANMIQSFFEENA